MKTNSINRIFLCSLFAVGVVAPAVAGQGPHETYAPVTKFVVRSDAQGGPTVVTFAKTTQDTKRSHDQSVPTSRARQEQILVLVDRAAAGIGKLN